MQRCRLTGTAMGYGITYSPLLSLPNYPGCSAVCLMPSRITSSCKQVERFSALGKAGELQKSVAKQDGEGKESCFSSELYYRHSSA